MPIDNPATTPSDQPKEAIEPKVLIVAFACEPGRGSEPGIGWGFVEEISKRRPVWVIADVEFREATLRYLATQHQFFPIHATFVGWPRLQWTKHWFLGMNIYYYLWQFLAARVGRRIHREVKFDLVQHVSFERYWMHSAGAAIGAPFLFGPVGGGEVWPSSMKSDMSFKDRLQSICWRMVRTIMEFDPFLRRTFKRTVAVIPSLEATKERMKRLGANTLDVMVCVAPKPTLPVSQEGPSPDGPFRFISIGRLPKWKGCHLGIRAFAQAFGPNSPSLNREVDYWIIGTGSELEPLKALADKLGVANKVHFAGDLPYAECLSNLAAAGAMVHPTLRDSAGVVFESLMLGVPVLCSDIGVPGVVVNDQSGAVVRTALGTDGVIKSMAETMRKWTTNSVEYAALRRGAVDRVRHFDREARGDRLDAIHRDLIQQSAARGQKR